MTQSSMQTLALYSILIIVTTLIGGAIPILKQWKQSTIRLFISFGAGVLLGVAFLHIIPEATSMIRTDVGLPLLLGFLFLYVLEKFIMVHSCEAGCEVHVVGWSSVFGLTIHSLTAGMALGAGLIVPEIGLFVFLAILLHKLPESFSLASILLHEHFSKARLFAIVFLFSLTIPIGAFTTVAVFGSFSNYTIGWLLAFSAGTFLHIAADDLLPSVHATEDNRNATLSTFLAGVILIWISNGLHG
ncbi:MAG: ZIP family metal transporter [bacterium]